MEDIHFDLTTKPKTSMDSIDWSSISGQPINNKQLSDNYEIISDLGEGTFGSVKLGKNKASNLKVAIKILGKSRIIDKTDKDRVIREIKILKEVSHPNFVKLFEIIENRLQNR